jgi:hypothetical protein
MDKIQPFAHPMHTAMVNYYIIVAKTYLEKYEGKLL